MNNEWRVTVVWLVCTLWWKPWQSTSWLNFVLILGSDRQQFSQPLELLLAQQSVLTGCSPAFLLSPTTPVKNVTHSPPFRTPHDHSSWHSHSHPLHSFESPTRSSTRQERSDIHEKTTREELTWTNNLAQAVKSQFDTTFERQQKMETLHCLQIANAEW